MNFKESIDNFKKENKPVWDEIALRASDMLEFQEAVRSAPSGLDAIKSVRGLLRTHFPEVLGMAESEVGYINPLTFPRGIGPRGKDFYDAHSSPRSTFPQNLVGGQETAGYSGKVGG